uniref:Amidohydrolase-related domain-containing protein n=1 Tax=Parascaris equorum TaxID=6256 RepID=A0A914RFN3_PAREQ
MDVRGKTLTAALIWTGNTFEKAIQIRVDSDGTIALIPGFVNAHSHAFHHHMRGRSHIGSATSENFWKWRDEMYSLMLSAGITTVGEFHYVHHGTKQFDLDSAILDAARDAQIRIVLIDTLYCRAGFGSEALANAQKRFISTTDELIASAEELDKSKHANQTIAVSAHSLRAVPLNDCIRLSEWATNNSKPLHIHIEEQPKEIVDCIDALHSSPSQLILDKITFAQRGINVCVCPLTEGYLGDGIPNIVDESQICLGTDCNNRICMLEEMRWLAYSYLQMKKNSRQACGLDARKLLRIATENGARSLGLEHTVGRFEVGMQLDFVAFDLSSPRIASIPTDELLDAIIFGADRNVFSLPLSRDSVLSANLAKTLDFQRIGAPMRAGDLKEAC